jgi:hypothetical protein
LVGSIDPRLHQVFEFLNCLVEPIGALVAPNLVDHHRTPVAGILSDPASRLVESPAPDVDAKFLLLVGAQALELEPALFAPPVVGLLGNVTLPAGLRCRPTVGNRTFTCRDTVTISSAL